MKKYIGTASLIAILLCGVTIAQKTTFQTKFLESYYGIGCPKEVLEDSNTAIKNSFCLAVTGKPEIAGFENLEMQRTAVLTNLEVSTVFASNLLACKGKYSFAMTNGTLKTLGTDSVNFAGVGVFCRNEGTAAYSVRFSSGTGIFQDVTGSAVIDVPPGGTTEIWTGELEK